MTMMPMAGLKMTIVIMTWNDCDLVDDDVCHLCSSDGLEVNEELELTTVVTVGLIKEGDGIEIELEGWVCRVVPNGI